MKMKVTTECGYRWRWNQMYKWKKAYKPRPLRLRRSEKLIGVAFGPLMVFWDYR